MSYEQYKESIKNVFYYLDTIDLASYLKQFKDKTLYDLINKLEKDFPYSDKYSDFLFACVPEGELMNYLNKKYNLSFHESIQYYIDSII